MISYKLQSFQILWDQDKITHCDFCTEMLGHCKDENGFMEGLIFNDF